jgi:hypothetical protein
MVATYHTKVYKTRSLYVRDKSKIVFQTSQCNFPRGPVTNTLFSVNRSASLTSLNVSEEVSAFHPLIVWRCLSLCTGTIFFACHWSMPSVYMASPISGLWSSCKYFLGCWSYRFSILGYFVFNGRNSMFIQLFTRVDSIVGINVLRIHVGDQGLNVIRKYRWSACNCSFKYLSSQWCQYLMLHWLHVSICCVFLIVVVKKNAYQ